MTAALYAAHPIPGHGRRVSEPPPAYRTEYQRDRDRIIHSAAFRRLEYKTQVFVNHEGDLFRTRLTHSLEVAQIARTVARTLGLDEDLVEAIALAHDLGHTPFGHAGQDALNGCMAPYGGFEHNAQSLRVVDWLEDKYVAFPGLNLTFETREGILKHCSRARAKALGEVGRRFLDGGQPSLEAQLANLADEIAYNNHDIDDGLRAGLLTFEGLREIGLFARHDDLVRERFGPLSPTQRRHEVVRGVIGEMVTNLTTTSQAAILAAGVDSLPAVRAEKSALIGYSADLKAENRQLKKYLMDHLYRHPKVIRMTRKAQAVVEDLFNVLYADIRLLPVGPGTAARAAEGADGETGRAVAVADYIASLTDRSAMDEHQRLFDIRRVD